MRYTRRTFLKTAGCLTIGFCLAADKTLSQPIAQHLPGDLGENPRIDSWLQVLEDGRVRVLTGKIELGQGIRTAVAQMAAEELDLDMHQVEVLMAETGVTPDEGYTAGSNSIEASAIAVRYAAAAARQKLLDLAAQKLGSPAADLTFSKGTITARNGKSISLAALLDGKQISDEVHMPVTIKPKMQHRLVGKPVPRPDNESTAARLSSNAARSLRECPPTRRSLLVRNGRSRNRPNRQNGHHQSQLFQTLYYARRYRSLLRRRSL